MKDASGAGLTGASSVENHARGATIAGAHRLMDIGMGNAEIAKTIGIESEQAL